MNLRAHQRKAMDGVKADLKAGYSRLLVDMATGLGKTPLFASTPDELGFAGRVLVIVHREELAQQAADKLRKWNPTRTVGIEMGDRRSNGEQLVVASVQTIGRAGSPRLQKLNPADFECVIIDEAHHAKAPSYLTVLKHFNVFEDKRVKVIGVTATAGEGLGKVFQKISFHMGIEDGIKEGWLADLRGQRIKTSVSLEGVQSKAGDFDLGQLSSRVNTPARNELVVQGWLQYGNNEQSLLYAVDVQHAKDLAAAFQRHGLKFEAVWGGDEERARKLSDHRQRKLKGLVNCELLIEGYDDWRIGCIGMTRPTESEGLYRQIVGRGTRIPENISNIVEARKQGLHIAKESCILLDYVDVTSKHSLVTLPSLFGLSKDMDLKGRSILKVTEEVKELKEEKPYLDVTQVTDATQIKAYAETVDLFRVSFPPEVLQHSEYQWRKTGENAYVLLLKGNQNVVVLKDMLDQWHIRGMVNDTIIQQTKPSFAEAIKEADFKVKIFGGRNLVSLVKREAKFHKGKPTEAQLILCRRLGIKVPPGATKGEVHLKLTQVIGEKQQKAAARRKIA